MDIEYWLVSWVTWLVVNGWFQFIDLWTVSYSASINPWTGCVWGRGGTIAPSPLGLTLLRLAHIDFPGVGHWRWRLWVKNVWVGVKIHTVWEQSKREECMFLHQMRCLQTLHPEGHNHLLVEDSQPSLILGHRGQLLGCSWVLTIHIYNNSFTL